MVKAALPLSGAVPPPARLITWPEEDTAVPVVTFATTPVELVSVIGTSVCVEVEDPEPDEPDAPVDPVDPEVLVGALIDAIDVDEAAVDVGGGAVAT